MDVKGLIKSAGEEELLRHVSNDNKLFKLFIPRKAVDGRNLVAIYSVADVIHLRGRPKIDGGGDQQPRTTRHNVDSSRRSGRTQYEAFMATGH